MYWWSRAMACWRGRSILIIFYKVIKNSPPGPLSSRREGEIYWFSDFNALIIFSLTFSILTQSIVESKLFEILTKCFENQQILETKLRESAMKIEELQELNESLKRIEETAFCQEKFDGQWYGVFLFYFKNIWSLFNASKIIKKQFKGWYNFR